MTIVVAILKILGPIVLILLGLLLLFVLLALFFPVGYFVQGISRDDVTVKGKIYWLFHAISVRVLYEEKQFSSEVRIFGIRLRKKEPSLIESYDEYDLEDEGERAEDAAAENAASINAAANEESEAGRESDSPKGADTVQADEPSADTGALPQEDKRQRTGRGMHRISMFERLRRRLRELIQKMRRLLASVRKIWGLLTAEENKSTLSGVFAELKYLLKHFRVRKIRSDLCFSTGDPASTGQVLGVLSLMPFLYQKGVRITPDFEAEKFYVRGKLEGSGHLRGIHVLVSGIRLWRDRNLRKIIKNFIS